MSKRTLPVVALGVAAGALALTGQPLLNLDNGSSLISVEADVEASPGVVVGPGGKAVIAIGGTSPPATPTHDVVVFAATEDSMRVLGSPPSGGPGDTHVSTEIQVDTAGGTFDPPQYHDVSLGAVTTDTVLAPAGSFVKSRIRYEFQNGGFTEWSDTLLTEMADGVDTIGAWPNEPAHFTRHTTELGDTHLWTGWENNSPIWTGTDPTNGPPVSISDPSCPVFNRSILMQWDAGDNGPGANKVRGMNWDSVFVGYYEKREAAYTILNKLFYVGEGGSSNNPTDMYFYYKGVAGGLGFNNQEASPPLYSISADTVVFAADVWVRVEIMMGRESVALAGDGHLSVWINGTLIWQSDTMLYSSEAGREPFGGLTWYEYDTNAVSAAMATWVCGLIVSHN